VATATQLADRLYLIDAHMFDQPERLSCYLFDTPQRVLIECGPSRSLHYLLAALDQLGIDDLAALVVTHIHLDHAGGAAQLAAHFPKARVGVHPAGARHLIDPSRLWDSAARIYGEDGMSALWGPMQPLATERVLVLEESTRLSLGAGRSLEVHYTPGHAKHHVVFYEDESGGAFVGDAVGVAFPHGHMVQPVTPPPDFDPVLISAGLRQLAALDPSFLGFAHFGPNYQPAAALAEAEQRLAEWVEFVTGLTDDAEASSKLRQWVLEGYRTQGIADSVIATYDTNTFWPMQAAGIQRWLGR